jgi:ABC-type amino acid transport system permease subunit
MLGAVDQFDRLKGIGLVAGLVIGTFVWIADGDANPPRLGSGGCGGIDVLLVTAAVVRFLLATASGTRRQVTAGLQVIGIEQRVAAAA